MKDYPALGDERSSSILVLLLLLLSAPIAAAQATITVDPSTRFQTINGWECVAFASQDDPAQTRQPLPGSSQICHQSQVENAPTRPVLGPMIDYATWRANRYATVNDNADANTINASGFHFTELDQNIRSIVLPLRAVAAAKGQPMYINLNYVAFTGQITQGGAYHHTNAAEYAEFILAVFQHMDQEFGFVPDAVEILLEPDNVSQWNGALWAGQSPQWSPAFPPLVTLRKSLRRPARTWEMRSVISMRSPLSGRLAGLDEICYHRYGGVSDVNLQALASRSQQHGKRASMLEWWSTGNSIDILLKDLTMGRNAAWQQGVLAGIGGLDDDMALYKVDTNSASGPLVRVNRKTRLLRQVYRFVRRGAVRVAATSSSGTLQPVAFINADGSHVVVVRATTASQLRIDGLPVGSYGINYSTAAEFNRSLSDQEIAAGAPITTNIPAAGVLTVYQLLPKLGATILNGDTLQLSVCSLKSGFVGSIERNTVLSNPEGWRRLEP
jgi:hypothetical protein